MSTASNDFTDLFREVWTTNGAVAALDLADQRVETAGSLSDEECRVIADQIHDLAIHDHEEALAAKPEPVLRRMLAFAKSRLGARHYAVADVLGALGRLCMGQDRTAEAEAFLLRELSAHEVNDRARHRRVGYPTHALSNLLAYYFAQKRFDDAVGLLEKQMDVLGGSASHAYAAHTLLNLGKAYIGQRRFPEAEEALLAAYAYFEKQPVSGGLGYNLYAQTALDLLGEVWRQHGE